MSIISVKNVSKHFKVLKRNEGLKGALKDLFSKDYKTVKAVDDISMSIEEGETVGFVGPNGAGKSTTIKMLTGILAPTDGQVLVNKYIPHKNRTKYVKNIGIVFGQRSQLWWDIPAIESFKILREIYEVEKKEFDANMGLFNELVNIKELFPIPVRNLSLGQRMLCDIVASFLHNPKIVFLDEPTIGLDISIKNKIRSMVQYLNNTKNMTVLLTSHDIDDIEKLCKRIIIIDKGKLIYNGETSKFNKIFGNFRTLKIDPGCNNSFLHFSEKINARFKLDEKIQVDLHEDGWIDIVINQDKVKLLDILTFLLENYSIKDIKVKEIELENIIEKVYLRELL